MEIYNFFFKQKKNICNVLVIKWAGQAHVQNFGDQMGWFGFEYGPDLDSWSYSSGLFTTIFFFDLWTPVIIFFLF